MHVLHDWWSHRRAWDVPPSVLGQMSPRGIGLVRRHRRRSARRVHFVGQPPSSPSIATNTPEPNHGHGYRERRHHKHCGRHHGTDDRDQYPPMIAAVWRGACGRIRHIGVRRADPRRRSVIREGRGLRERHVTRMEKMDAVGDLFISVAAAARSLLAPLLCGGRRLFAAALDPSVREHTLITTPPAHDTRVSFNGGFVLQCRVTRFQMCQPVESIPRSPLG